MDNCTRVIEPSILLYFVSKSKLEEKDSPLNLCVFGKKQLHQVQIRKEGIKRLKINYIEESKENSTLRKGETETVKFSFTTRSLVEQNQKAELFSFLGLKGNFDIYTDKKSGIPVQVSGAIPGLGNVNIRLSKAELRKRNR